MSEKLCTVVLLVSLLISITVTSFMESGEELRRIFSDTSTEKRKIISEYSTTYNSYLKNEREMLLSKEYNTLVDAGNIMLKKKVSKISKELSTDILQRDRYFDEINTNVGIYDIKYLKSLDRKIKVLNSEISDKKSELEDLKLIPRKKVPDKEVVKVAVSTVKKDIVLQTSKGTIGKLNLIKPPVQGKIIRKYSRTGKGFNGVEYAAPVGSKVTTILDGKVVEVGSDFYVGSYVKILHDKGIMSIYGHMSSVSVKKGDILKQNNSIGLSGDTGITDVPKLSVHFYIDGIPKDLTIIGGK